VGATSAAAGPSFAADSCAWEQEDGERRGIGKDVYRESRDAEGNSNPTTLHKLLEMSFMIFSLFLHIHSDLHKLLELLLTMVSSLFK
jgi:hypothetical protein